MNNIISYIKIAFAFCTGIAINMLGGWDMALQSLFTLTVLDFLTGVIVAVGGKKLSSGMAFRGIAKKIGIYTLIAVVVTGGNALGNNDLRGIVIGFFIATEIISIVENWANFGLPI
ncbi:MAG: phage holin family protein, partial [Oscillospiraceae bacterium]|nr:phage holin family protein [Oscillospiraceae bacterium]